MKELVGVVMSPLNSKERDWWHAFDLADLVVISAINNLNGSYNCDGINSEGYEVDQDISKNDIKVLGELEE
jgi:hypothetical protein